MLKVFTIIDLEKCLVDRNTSVSGENLFVCDINREQCGFYRTIISILSLAIANYNH